MATTFDFARIAAEPLHNGEGTVITDGPADAIATVHRYRGESSHDRAVALFANAPAMIEAIEGLLAAFESDDPKADRAGWKMQARRAVYLAKGGK